MLHRLKRCLTVAGSLGAFIISILAFFHPYYVQREAELNTPIGYRNLAFLSQRYIIQSMKAAQNRERPPYDDIAFQTIQTAMDAIQFKDISPAPLIENFVNLWNGTKNAERITKEHLDDRKLIERILYNACRDLNQIDQCLESTGLVQFQKSTDWCGSKKGSAARATNFYSFHDLYWHWFERSFCELRPSETATGKAGQ